jgi:RimJ/RimL family protein N-acetyltransferase
MPDAQILRGRLVDLERLEPTRHGADLWRAVGGSPALWHSVPPGPFSDQAAFVQWLEERSVRPDQALYAVISKRAHREATGLYFLISIEAAVGRTEVGLVLGPALARSTGATEALFLIAGYVFDGLGYRRLEWRCNPENEASVRAATRFGFRLEGVLRQNTWLKGRNWDTAVYSIIDAEWPARAKRLAQWLAPENFGRDGNQIRALSDIP